MQSHSRCNKRTECYFPATNPVSCNAYTAENASLEIFEAVQNHGTAFAPKHYSYQKGAGGMENPKMQSHARCNKRTARYCPANNQVSCTAYRAENADLVIFEAVENHGTTFAPKQY